MSDIKEAVDLFRFRPAGSDRWSEWRVGRANLSPASGCEWEERVFYSHPPASREEGLREAAKMVAGLRDDSRQEPMDFKEIAERILALIPTKPEAKEGLRADLTKILNVDLNVTDEELLRIRNMCERDGDVKIWARMVQKLTDAVRRGRESLREQS